MEKINSSRQRESYDDPSIWFIQQNQNLKNECIFLDKVFKKHKTKRILSIGCGTGLHCNYLEKLKYSIVGTDLNKNLIKHAKKEFPKVVFFNEKQDQELFENKFDATYELSTPISYKTKNQELIKIFENYYKTLRRGGILIIEVFNPTILINKSEKEKREGIEKNELKYYKKWGETTYTDEFTLYNSRQDETTDENRDDKKLKLPRKIEFLLEQTGFKILGFYGDFNVKHKKLNKNKIIVVAKKLSNI